MVFATTGLLINCTFLFTLKTLAKLEGKARDTSSYRGLIGPKAR